RPRAAASGGRCLRAGAAAGRRGFRGLIMSTATQLSIARAPFGETPDGAVVESVTLRGADGFEAVIINFGAVLHALKVPDRAGRSEDILLGNDDLSGYLAQRRFFGATIGRYANRIAGARFVLDGDDVQLDANNG